MSECVVVISIDESLFLCKRGGELLFCSVKPVWSSHHHTKVFMKTCKKEKGEILGNNCC